MTPGITAIETAETPETNAKNTATNLRECKSPFCPIIFILLCFLPARLFPTPEALLAGLGTARGFDAA
jgi:hypothetical protein